MARKLGIEFVWTLNAFRNGEQGLVRTLEQAEFRYGRTRDETLEFGIRILPTGLVSLIKHSGLEEESLESGFTLEISRMPISDKEWLNFEKLVGDDAFGPNWESPRSVYASSDLREQ